MKSKEITARLCVVAGLLACLWLLGASQTLLGQEQATSCPTSAPASLPAAPATRPAESPATQPAAPASQPASAPATQPAGQDPMASWFGLLPKCADAGVTPSLSYIMDSSKNFRGGVHTDEWAIRYLLTAGLTFDMDKLAGIKGGTAYVSFTDHHGTDGSSLTGAIQRYSTIDGTGRDELYEVWYQQKLFEDKLRVKAGKIDANTEFAYVVNGQEFLNSSMGYSPAIVDFPTYQDPDYGVNVFGYPTEWFYAGFGLFDRALQERWPVGSPKPLNSGEFIIGEAGLKWQAGPDKLAGRLGAGYWGHSGGFAELDGGRLSGTAGPYAVLDQTLWRHNPADKDDPRQLGAFFQYGWADQQIAEIRQHFGGGLAWTGPIAARPNDVLGVGLSIVNLSDDQPGLQSHHEESIETFYKIAITPWLSLKPDLQYIIDPGGKYPDALVGTIRLQISW
jgi:porin